MVKLIIEGMIDIRIQLLKNVRREPPKEKFLIFLTNIR